MGQTDWALVVGVSRYAAKEFEALRGPERDAIDFHSWIVDAAGGQVPAPQAARILSSDFKTGGRPTSDQIDAFFLNLEKIAKRNLKKGNGLMVGRRLYVFLSGHGFAPMPNEAALLAANASPTRLKFHVPGKAWADTFYRGLWFEEILLFMDCCRNVLPNAIPNPPALAVPSHPDHLTRGRRLFGFATGNGRMARERVFGNETRGVFTKTLMEGLRGAASMPATGQITAHSLRNYLLNNMRGFLAPADLENPAIPKEPALEPSQAEAGPDFVIAEVKVKGFPVEIATPAGNEGKVMNVRGPDFAILHTTAAPAGVWKLQLPSGNYALEIVGGPPMKAFKVMAGQVTHV